MKTDMNTNKYGYGTSLLLILLIIFGSFFASCEKEGDVESPIAQIDAPEIGQKYYRGGVIYLNTLITDNEGLDRCEVSMASTKSTFGWDDPWEPETDVIMLSGTEHHIEEHLLFNGPIPFEVMSAPYVINIRIYDVNGNMTHYSRNIEIE